MMKRIFVPTRNGTDWQRLLAKPILHWKKGASAMTAAAAWEDAANKLPKEISHLLTSTPEPLLQNLELLAAIPEWEVKLPGGDTTSNTDILALCRNKVGLAVVAVEAKVLEDFGPLVGEKRDSASQNQASRLQYLHELLKVDWFANEIRYQLLHRTASAILTAVDFHASVAVMMVHAFATPVARRGDFTAFCAAMGATEIVPNVYKVPCFTQPELYLAWCDGDEKYRAIELENAFK
jgi:hypothetical protein